MGVINKHLDRKGDALALHSVRVFKLFAKGEVFKPFAFSFGNQLKRQP